jgi:uncharacterized protein (TIGR02147 family)
MKINVFDYSDYRLFLNDFFADKKKSKSSFSARAFSRAAGLKAPGYLGLVIRGTRNLSPASIGAFAKALKLSPKETTYFKTLVLFNQTSIEADKEEYYERLQKLMPPITAKGLEKFQYEYFHHPYFVVIREMVALPHFQEDHEWIAGRLSPVVKPAEVKHAIAVLLRLKLLERDQSGKLKQKDSVVNTPAEVSSMELIKHNRDLLLLAQRALLTVPGPERDYTTLTIPLTQKSFPKIKAILQECRDRIIDYVNQGEGDFHEVYQLNIQLFPATATGLLR